MSYPKQDSYNKVMGKPSDDISPHKKQNDPSYALNWSQFIYSDHVRGSTGITRQNMSRLDYLRSYAYGRQNSNIYKKYFAVEDSNAAVSQSVSVDSNADTEGKALQKGRLHYMDVDFNDIFSPAPKYINNLIGRFSKIDLSTTVNAVDERSGAEKEMMKWKKWAQSKVKKDMDQVDQIRGVEPQESGESLPKTLEELHMYEQMGKFKTMYEVAMEKALHFTKELSEQPEIQKKVITDILVANIGAYETIIDKYDGLVKDEYVDPKNLIIEYTSEDMFDKSRYYGNIKNFRIADVRVKLPDLDEEELEGLAREYQGMYGNPDAVDGQFNEDNQQYGYDNFSIPVLKTAWITTDKHMFTSRKNGDGEEMTKRADGDEQGKPRIRNNKGRKTYPLYIKTVYEAYWIIGTNYVFDYGKMTDIPFDITKKEVRLPINAYKIKGKSIIESMIPMLNQIQMTYLKLQNNIAKAPPSGLKIDIGKTKSVTMNGRKFGPLDLITMYTQSGHMVYDSSLNEGQVTPGFQAQDPGKAIEQLNGGLGNAIVEAIQSWEMAFQAISDITGIDRASTATSQPERTSASETRIAAAGTSDTLYPIIDAWSHMVKRGSENAALRIQSRCSVEKSPYIAIIGEAGTKAIAQAAGTPPIQWGIVLKAQSTEQERNDLIQAAQLALKSGILSYSQFMFVENTLNTGGGLNAAQQFIAYQEAEAEKSQTENARAAQEADTQKQTQMIQDKKMADAETKTLENNLEKDKITHQANEDIRILEAEKDLGLGSFKQNEAVI